MPLAVDPTMEVPLLHLRGRNMRWNERQSVPRLERLETRNLLSAIAGTIDGALVNGPLAGKHTPPGDFRIFGSGSIHPLGRVKASGISPLSGDVPRSMTLRDPRGFVRLDLSGQGAERPGTSFAVQVMITGHSPGLGVRTGDRGTGTFEEGLPTPGGTIAFQFTFDIR
jgi:hypothetical protein